MHLWENNSARNKLHITEYIILMLIMGELRFVPPITNIRQLVQMFGKKIFFSRFRAGVRDAGCPEIFFDCVTEVRNDFSTEDHKIKKEGDSNTLISYLK